MAIQPQFVLDYWHVCDNEPLDCQCELCVRWRTQHGAECEATNPRCATCPNRVAQVMEG